MPGNHGSLTLYYARITDIAVGVCIVLLFDLVIPWCALDFCGNLPSPSHVKSIRIATCIIQGQGPTEPFVSSSTTSNKSKRNYWSSRMLCA